MLDLMIKAKSFGAEIILRDIQLSLGTGARHAILGPSGIGKSTLLRIIAGLDPQFTGHCNRPKKCAIMFQNPTLLPWRTALQNLSIFHPDAPRTALQDALDNVGLAEKGQHFPNQLSVGQQRRLALARTFLGQADLVLLDEPFASLDNDLRHSMLDLTKRLLDNAGSALVLVTHDAYEATALGAEHGFLRTQHNKAGAIFATPVTTAHKI